MVILGQWGQRPITLSLKASSLTVSVGRPDASHVFSYDLSGRLWSAYLGGVTHRRGLNGRIVAKWRAASGERQRRWLPPDQALDIEEQAQQTIAALYDAMRSGAAQLSTALPQEGHFAFERAVAFDSTRSAEDAERYHQLYKPVGILPPDQYLAVVLQATEGCSFNTCTFCDFYRDRPFRIKTPGELHGHALAVRDFLGEGLSLRRSIFLADANALAVPMARLLPLIDAVHQVFDVTALGGLYAFLDGFSGEKKSEADYALLKERGLARVYVGLESGNEALLRFLKKPGQPEDALAAVRAMKAGGLAVGVIVLLGAGGQQYADDHVKDTVAALNAMQLGNEDIIYFSELVVSEELPYAQDAARAGLAPLTHAERLAQGEAIRRGLRFDGDGPRISRYDIREFVY